MLEFAVKKIMKKNRLIVIPIMIFLTLTILRMKNWQVLHDEGVTFDQAFGVVDLEAAAGDPVSWDEIASTLNNGSSHSLADVTFALQTRGMHPPAYYYLIHAWTKCFGTRPPALRIPGILLGLISLVGIWFLAERIINRQWAGFLAAILLSVSIVFIDYNIYLRPYGLELAITIWATWTALKLGAQKDKRTELTDWSIFISLSILGIYTIYHYAFTLAWHFCFIFLALFIAGKLQRTELTKLIASGFLILLTYLPWAANLRHHLANTAGSFYFGSFIPAENWPNSLKALFESFIFGYHTEPVKAVSSGLRVVAVITVILFFKAVIPHFKKNLTEPVFWFSSIFLPLFIIAADFWHNTHTFFILRTSIVLLPLMILAAAIGIFGINNIWLKGLLSGFWVSLLLLTSISNMVSAGAAVPDRKALVNHMLKYDRPAHVAVFNDRERGYLIPVLAALRDGGVEQIQIAVAGRKELFDVILKLSRDTNVEQISLINLDIKYDRDAVWTGAEVEKVVDIIKRAGKTFKIFKLASRYI